MRGPVFAGSFYPGAKFELESFIDKAMAGASIKAVAVKDALAFVAPHAGYVYSGKTAAHTYKAASSGAAASAESVVLIGPNHTGLGMPIAVSLEDWRTPLGTVRNDVALSKAIIAASGSISADESAHSDEHSIEVQLPFVQRALLGKSACMICMGDQSMGAASELAAAIESASEKLHRRIIVLASSDFNHYEPASTAKEKDEKLISALERMDERAFYSAILKTGDSACGFGPITVAMLFAKHAGAKKGLLLDYSNSGDTTHDSSSVVAYASLAFV